MEEDEFPASTPIGVSVSSSVSAAAASASATAAASSVEEEGEPMDTADVPRHRAKKSKTAALSQPKMAKAAPASKSSAATSHSKQFVPLQFFPRDYISSSQRSRLSLGSSFPQSSKQESTSSSQKSFSLKDFVNMVTKNRELREAQMLKSPTGDVSTVNIPGGECTEGGNAF